NGQLHEAAVRQMLGAVDRSYVFQLIDALAQGDGKTVVETSDTLRIHGLSAASTLEEMATVLQRMAVFQAVPQMASAADADDPEVAETARLAALMPADETQLLYSLCLHGRGELGLAPDEYAALTMVLLRLLAFKPPSDLAEKKTLIRPERDAASGGARGIGALGSTGSAVSTTPALPSAPSVSKVAAPLSPAISPLVADASGSTMNAAVPVHHGAPASATASAASASAVVPTAPLGPLTIDAAPTAVTPNFEQGLADDQASNTLPEPPPWPGSEDAETADSHTVSAPVPQEVNTPKIVQNRPLAQANKAQAAPDVVAISEGGAAGQSVRLQPTPQSTPVPASALYTPTVEGDVWHATVQQLVAADAIAALVRELALQSQLVARDGGHWLLRVERESLNQPVARERLRAALEAGGHAAQISVELGAVTDSPARRNAAAAAQRQRRAEEIVRNDPFVQSLMRDYGAKIVPGSIKPA
ncbi:MAG: DNA polymerase III subunit gamma/tau, partial [Burkholderiaceae bacterium]|nr:DNA polymerase III subunit gamma/tau [Burkholderiaceae bacterium]